MFTRLLAVLSVLSAPAICQSDADEAAAAQAAADAAAANAERTDVVNGSHVRTEVYGQDLTDDASMSLVLGLKANDERVTFTTSGGTPGAPAALLIGFKEARVSLAPIGIDGWLLVDQVVLTGMSHFDGGGEAATAIPVTDAMIGLDLRLQAGSISFDDKTPSIRMSNGLRFSVGA